ncbi:MAG: hypothetical protein WAM11_04955 [Cyanobium sp.]
MSPEKPAGRRRGTPISDSFGADLQTLGTILAHHTRGLDDYLQRQATRLEERHQILMAESPGFLLSPDLNLEAMTAGELRDLCRRQRLRGWSKLRREELLAFVQQNLGAELEAMRILRQEPAEEEARQEAADAGNGVPTDASRTERLLLLLLHHLGVAPAQVEAAWQGVAPG